MIEGIGIHSGERCRVRLHRVDGPLGFRRGDAFIPAHVDAVADTRRCVVLQNGAAKVATVEHLLAALHVAGFWSGVLVELDGPELPILDGSALPWSDEVAQLGEPPLTPPALLPSRPLSLGSTAGVQPGEAHLEVQIDFDHPAIGKQCWGGGPARWGELLDARTFGFLSELETLQKAGLARAAALENAIVFDDRGPLGEMRGADEPVRHKALDLLGDMVLLGRPLEAAVKVKRGSHTIHVNLMRLLLRESQMEAET